MIILSIVVLFVFFIFFKISIKGIPNNLILLHPHFWFSYHFLLNYPLRAFLIGIKYQQPIFDIDEKYMIASLSYALIFYIISSYLNYIFNNTKHKYFNPIKKNIFLISSNNFWKYFALILIFFICLGYIIAIKEDSFNYVGRTVTEADYSLIKAISMNFSALVYFLYGISLFNLKREKNSLMLKVIFIICIFLLYLRGIIAGSRGFYFIAIYLIIIALFYNNELRKITGVFIFFIFMGIILSIGTTIFRTGSAEFIFNEKYDAITRINKSFKESNLKYIGQILEHSIERNTYQLDSSAYLLKDYYKNDNKNKGRYRFGSLIDLRHLMPKFVWVDRDFENFTYWMGSYIYNASYMNLYYPVGRIGESIYILGYMGIIFSIFNAFMCAFLFRKFFSSNIIFWKLIYIQILVLWGISGQGTFFWDLINPLKNILYFILLLGFYSLLYNLFKLN